MPRDDVEPLRAAFADHMHRAAAARAGGIFRFDDDSTRGRCLALEDLEQAVAEKADPALRKARSDS